MSAIRPILASSSISISDLKKNPMEILEQGDGFAVAVLNRNKPVFYCVPADTYASLLQKLESYELLAEEEK